MDEPMVIGMAIMSICLIMDALLSFTALRRCRFMLYRIARLFPRYIRNIITRPAMDPAVAPKVAPAAADSRDLSMK